VFSAKIVRKGQDEKWYNFVNATEILPHKRSKFRVKINKAKNNYLMVGFCTSAGLGVVNNYDKPESAYYGCNGYMWEGRTNSSEIVVESRVDDVVEAEANLGAGVLRWWRNGALLKESAIPQQMKGKTAFLSIIMPYAGSEVDLSI
jgi:hypothetical protein